MCRFDIARINRKIDVAINLGYMASFCDGWITCGTKYKKEAVQKVNYCHPQLDWGSYN